MLLFGVSFFFPVYLASRRSSEAKEQRAGSINREGRRLMPIVIVATSNYLYHLLSPFTILPSSLSQPKL